MTQEKRSSWFTIDYRLIALTELTLSDEALKPNYAVIPPAPTTPPPEQSTSPFLIATRPKTASTGKPSFATPPRPQSPTERLPMTTINTFIKVHRANAERLQQYQAMRRRGYLRLDRAVMEEFDERGDVQLSSNNPDARIRFATVCYRDLRSFLGRSEDVGFQWVTLAPGQYALPLEQAAQFDPRKIVGWTHQAMRGFNFCSLFECQLDDPASGMALGV